MIGRHFEWEVMDTFDRYLLACFDSRRLEDDAGVDDDVVLRARQDQLYVVVLELVVEAGSHPRLDLRHPQLVHPVYQAHVEHVYVVGLSVDGLERRPPFPVLGVPELGRATRAAALLVLF